MTIYENLERRANILLLSKGFNKEGKKVIKKNNSSYGSKEFEGKLHREVSQEAISNNRDFILKRGRSSMSLGEKKVRDFLVTERINFGREVHMKGLVNPETRKPLFFDFYISSMKLVVEFDGVQHFEMGTQTKEQFESAKKRDSIKDKFCKKKGITMLRIPYWEINRVDHILRETCDKIINKLS